MAYPDLNEELLFDESMISNHHEIHGDHFFTLTVPIQVHISSSKGKIRTNLPLESNDVEERIYRWWTLGEYEKYGRK